MLCRALGAPLAHLPLGLPVHLICLILPLRLVLSTLALAAPLAGWVVLLRARARPYTIRSAPSARNSGTGARPPSGPGVVLLGALPVQVARLRASTPSAPSLTRHEVRQTSGPGAVLR